MNKAKRQKAQMKERLAEVKAQARQDEEKLEVLTKRLQNQWWDDEAELRDMTAGGKNILDRIKYNRQEQMALERRMKEGK